MDTEITNEMRAAVAALKLFQNRIFLMTPNRTAVSLFTGAGGMDIGFERAGFKVVWANELMPHAAATFERNHQPGIMRSGALSTFVDELHNLRDIFCVFGGPPCQGFSVAGKMDPKDERSKLVFDFLDVVSIVSPRVFVMENVRGLGQLAKFSDVREEFFRRAHTLGYGVFMNVLNAKDFGVPQSRERVFFVGVEKELGLQFSVGHLEPYKREPPSVGDILRAIGPAATPDNPISCKANITIAAKPVMRKSPYAGMLFNGLGRPLKTDGVSCTLPASMGGNKTPIVDEAHVYDSQESWVEAYHKHLKEGGEPLGMYDAPPRLRRLTLREAKALQTFPEAYEFAGPMSSQYTQVGNAVPCDLAFAVAKAVLDVFAQKTARKSKGQQVFELA